MKQIKQMVIENMSMHLQSVSSFNLLGIFTMLGWGLHPHPYYHEQRFNPYLNKRDLTPYPPYPPPLAGFST